MADAFISISQSDTPRAIVNTISSGERFITLRCGPMVTVSLPAYDVVAAAYARGIAATLLQAADEIDQALSAAQSVAHVGSLGRVYGADGASPEPIPDTAPIADTLPMDTEGVSGDAL